MQAVLYFDKFLSPTVTFITLFFGLIKLTALVYPVG
jgi:hypothetical protein